MSFAEFLVERNMQNFIKVQIKETLNPRMFHENRFSDFESQQSA